MRRLLLYAALAVWFGAIGGYLGATADPVVRRVVVHVASYPEGVAPVTLALVSDTHVVGPDMPPARLERLVAVVNATRPDIVALAGDFMSERGLATRHYPPAAAIAPLAALRPRLGSVAVLGNHDHDVDPAAVSAALEAAGIVVLDNRAVRIGPLAIAGSDNRLLGKQTLEPAFLALREAPGVGVLLSHYPGGFRFLPDTVPLMLAGHTHCGQIVLPFVGPIITMGVPRNQSCGIVRSAGHTLIVSAGLGNSILPIRIGVRPDLWLVTILR